MLWLVQSYTCHTWSAASQSAQMTLGLIAVILPSALSLIKVFLFPLALRYAQDTETYLFGHPLLLINVTGEKEGIDNRTGSVSTTGEHMTQPRKLCLLRRQG